jgi:hypothetical protein
MTRISLLILGILLIHATGQAMIRTIPFPELVKTADLIVVAKVTEQVPEADSPPAPPRVKNVLTLERSLKGDWTAEKPLVFHTADRQGKRREDFVEFPAVGERVVLFLKKATDGSLTIMNRIQGLWPLQTGSDKTLGMGFNYSLEAIEKAVKTP